MKDSKQKKEERNSLSKVKPILGRRKVKITEKQEILKKSKGDGKVKEPRIQKFKIAVRNFPLLMTREMRRVRWVKRFELNRSFWLTVAFITFFALFFALFQYLLQLLLDTAHVI